jgi:hypothetical protein
MVMKRAARLILVLSALALTPAVNLVWRRFSKLLARWIHRLRLSVRFGMAALRLSEAAAANAACLPNDWLAVTLQMALRPNADDDDSPMAEEYVLAIDVGGTRTKFLLCAMPLRGRGPVHVRHLPPVPTAQLWQNPHLETDDKFEPEGAPHRVRAYLRECGVESEALDRLIFAVPGTVDLTTESSDRSDYTIVKNTPSMSPRFRGFDFKLAFREVCPRAKVSAVPDGLAAALGVACENRNLRSALVLILGVFSIWLPPPPLQTYARHLPLQCFVRTHHPLARRSTPPVLYFGHRPLLHALFGHRPLPRALLWAIASPRCHTSGTALSLHHISGSVHTLSVLPAMYLRPDPPCAPWLPPCTLQSHSLPRYPI